jgi:hypothetical protein
MAARKGPGTLKARTFVDKEWQADAVQMTAEGPPLDRSVL